MQKRILTNVDFAVGALLIIAGILAIVSIIFPGTFLMTAINLSR